MSSSFLRAQMKSKKPIRLLPLFVSTSTSAQINLTVKIEELKREKKKEEERIQKYVEEENKKKLRGFEGKANDLLKVFAQLSLSPNNEKHQSIMIERHEGTCVCLSDYGCSCQNDYYYYYLSSSDKKYGSRKDGPIFTDGPIFMVHRREDSELILFLIRYGFNIEPSQSPSSTKAYVVSLSS